MCEVTLGGKATVIDGVITSTRGSGVRPSVRLVGEAATVPVLTNHSGLFLFIAFIFIFICFIIKCQS